MSDWCKFTGKQTHASKAGAVDAASFQAKRHRGKGRDTNRLYPYSCPHCGGWHLSGTRPLRPGQ
jgi:hypothetical protein